MARWHCGQIHVRLRSRGRAKAESIITLARRLVVQREFEGNRLRQTTDTRDTIMANRGSGADASRQCPSVPRMPDSPALRAESGLESPVSPTRARVLSDRKTLLSHAKRWRMRPGGRGIERLVLGREGCCEGCRSPDEVKPSGTRPARRFGLLCRLPRREPAAVRRGASCDSRRMTRVDAVTSAERFTRIDRVSEQTVTGVVAQHWPGRWPLELVSGGARTK